MQNDNIVSIINVIIGILVIVYWILLKRAKSYIGKGLKARKFISYTIVVLYITRIIISFIINESIIFTIWYILITLIWISIFSKDILCSRVYDFMKRTGTLEEVLDKDSNHKDNNKSE